MGKKRVARETMENYLVRKRLTFLEQFFFYIFFILIVEILKMLLILLTKEGTYFQRLSY